MGNPGYVLDASAALALLFAETGQEEVAKALESGHVQMSAVNYAEAFGRLKAFGASKTEAAEALDTLGVAIIPFDKEQAVIAGDLAQATAPLGLSLGDRACLALSKQTGHSAITADKAWAGLKFHPKVRLIR